MLSPSAPSSGFPPCAMSADRSGHPSVVLRHALLLHPSGGAGLVSSARCAARSALSSAPDSRLLMPGRSPIAFPSSDEGDSDGCLLTGTPFHSVVFISGRFVLVYCRVFFCAT